MLTAILFSALLAAQTQTQTQTQAHVPLGEADLAPAFGNTLLSTYPDGRTARMWLQPGGRFEGRGRRGGLSSGVWRVRGGRLCLSQRRPVPVPGAFCTPIVRGGVGTHWSAKAVTGETIRVDLIAGR